MANYTTNYSLTKPTLLEVADIRVLNANFDTVDELIHKTQVSLCDAYDTTSTYTVGDRCMYNQELYVCISPVSTPGAWDSTKWQRDTIIDACMEEDFTGATANDPGTSGLVPAPASGDREKFLCGDGTWKTVSGGGSVIDYSTTEQNTGQKWIDGKDIYMCTFQLSQQLLLSDNNWTATTIPIGSIDNILDCKAQLIDTTNNYYTYWDGISATRNIGSYINLLSSRVNGTVGISHVTLWYTKQTT